jgi:hypothetical protein
VTGTFTPKGPAADRESSRRLLPIQPHGRVLGSCDPPVGCYPRLAVFLSRGSAGGYLQQPPGFRAKKGAAETAPE